MSDEYTPTTEEVRADYVRDHTRNFDSYLLGRSLTSEQEVYGDRFDRWLAAHDAEVLAAAGVTQPEPKYEYQWGHPNSDFNSDFFGYDPHPTYKEALADMRVVVRRVKASAWERVPNQTGETDGRS